MSESGKRPIVLARYLALAWFGLIVYGSLHPFAGWRANGISPWAFLDADWPRYWTAFDLLSNIAVYLPLGFFLTLALRSLPWRFTAPLLAIVLSAATSLGMELLQNWLPSRIPSHLDLGCNAFGGMLGAIGAQLAGPRIFEHLDHWAQRMLVPARHGELGLTLLGLWLMVPLSPETLLFGAGDLRQIFDLTPVLPFSVELFARLEAGIVALNAIAIGLLLRSLLARRRIAYLLVPLFLICGLAIRTLGTAILIGPEDALDWLTPGARHGLLLAAAVLLLTLWLPRRASLWLALLAVVAATLLVNLAPANPYSDAALAAWRQGHFLNFNGLTRLVASLWPFLALPFLLLTLQQSARRFT